MRGGRIGPTRYHDLGNSFHKYVQKTDRIKPYFRENMGLGRSREKKEHARVWQEIILMADLSYPEKRSILKVSH